MPEQAQFEIPQPSPEIFQQPQRSQVHQVLSEKQVLFLVTKIEYPEEGGIYIHYQGIPEKYKRKGFVFPEAISAINNVKRMTIGLLQLLAHKKYLLPFYDLEKVLQIWNRQAEWNLHSVYLQDFRYGNQMKELRKFIATFLVNYGISQETALQAALNFITLIEYDDSYRYRVEDIFSVISQIDLLKNPRKEINRVLEIYLSREHSGITDKFKSIAKLLSLSLLAPKVKNAFRQAVKTTDISKIGLDEADSYWVLLRNDYDYQGKTIEQRSEEYKEIHKDKMPERIFMN